MRVSYDKLWNILADRGMNKKDLREQIDVSWATITKMSNGKTVNMNVILKICKLFHCNIGDIVDVVDDENIVIQYPGRKDQSLIKM